MRFVAQATEIPNASTRSAAWTAVTHMPRTTPGVTGSEATTDRAAASTAAGLAGEAVSTAAGSEAEAVAGSAAGAVAFVASERTVDEPWGGVFNDRISQTPCAGRPERT